MKLPKEIVKAITKIYDTTSPESIFLYGSRARGDYIDESDYEVGLLYTSEKRVKKEILATMHPLKNLHLYSFPLEDFTRYNAQVLFTRAIYFRELLDKNGAITLLGKPILETMKPPPILLSDMLEEVSFNKARALCAMLSFRQNDIVLATDHLIKSSFYASKMLLLYMTGAFTPRYDEIVKQIQLLPEEVNYSSHVRYVLSIRKKQVAIDLKRIYENISYVDFVFGLIEKRYKAEGDVVVIPSVS